MWKFVRVEDLDIGVFMEFVFDKCNMFMGCK